MADSPSKARRPRWHKAEVVEAAAECFMETGFHATTVEDVARRLGCTKGRIYHHYSSKTELFFAVHREGMARLFAAQEAAMAALGPKAGAFARIEARLLAHAAAMQEHHTYESVVSQGVQLHRFNTAKPEARATLAELIASRDRFESLIKASLAECMEAGAVARSDVSITAKMLLGALQWSIFWYRPRSEDGPEARAALAAKMVEPLLEGLRPR